MSSWATISGFRGAFCGDIGGLQLREPSQVRLEIAVLAAAVLKAAQVGIQLGRWPRRERVNDHLPVPPRLDKRMPPEICQVLRHLDLRRIEHGLEMANAKRPAREQMHDPQPSQTFCVKPPRRNASVAAISAASVCAETACG